MLQKTTIITFYDVNGSTEVSIFGHLPAPDCLPCIRFENFDNTLACNTFSLIWHQNLESDLQGLTGVITGIERVLHGNIKSGNIMLMHPLPTYESVPRHVLHKIFVWQGKIFK